MHRFRNILLVYNPKAANEAALTRAAELAERDCAELTVVMVVEATLHGLRVTSRTKQPSDVQEFVVKAASEELKLFLAPIEKARIAVHSTVLLGRPCLEITRMVMREKHDLVITTAEGSLATRLFGSTSLRLIRKCPCPVWAIKSTQRKPHAKILAAVDVDPDTPENEKDALNVKIIDLATSLAQQEESELHVVQAWTLPAEKYLRSGWLLLTSQVPEWLRERRDAYQERLNELLRKYAPMNVTFHVHLVKGDADSLIPELARAEQIDLIVMGTVRQVGVAGFLIGSTAETILQHVDCSVLAVKPEGFV